VAAKRVPSGIHTSTTNCGRSAGGKKRCGTGAEQRRPGDHRERRDGEVRPWARHRPRHRPLVGGLHHVERRAPPARRGGLARGGVRAQPGLDERQAEQRREEHRHAERAQERHRHRERQRADELATGAGEQQA
jgi:hypothetical protein